MIWIKAVTAIVVSCWLVRRALAQRRHFRPFTVGPMGSVVCGTSSPDYTLTVGYEVGIPSTVPGEVRCASNCNKQNKIGGCVGFNYWTGGTQAGTCHLYAQTPISFENTMPYCYYYQVANAIDNNSDAEALAQLSIVGCFTDCTRGGYLSVRDLPYAVTKTTTNSLGYCRKRCYNLGYSYAGAQAGHWCLCGNTLPTLKSTNCNLACSGRPTQVCGGHCTNTVMFTGI